MLTDTLTGVRQRFDRKAEIQGRINAIALREKEIPRDQVRSWNGDLEFSGASEHIPVYLYDVHGVQIDSYATLVERAYAPLRVIEWLREMGLGEVARVGGANIDVAG